MSPMTKLLACAALLTFAAPAWARDPATPNEFIARGTPTFVVGTAGDDDCDARIRAQVDLLRGMLFPDAKVMLDTEIDPAGGLEAWPANPILYGGPHVNRLLAAIRGFLPFEMEAGRLVLGDRELAGDEYRLLTVVPGRYETDKGFTWPSFLLYAGTGTPGVAEINGISHGGEAILVADRFGRYAVGRWVAPARGLVRAELTATARRIEWRATESAPGVRIHRAKVLPAAEGEANRDAAIADALRGAAKKLQVEDPVGVRVYLYPDARSKLSLTGDGGDGRADPEVRTVHVLEGNVGALTGLLAHEGAHVYAYHHWGPAGTPLLAEGLAVWVTGTYRFTLLDEWAELLPGPPPDSADLLHRFRKLPEGTSYPWAGLHFGRLVREHGLAAVRDRCYGAGPEELEKVMVADPR